MSVHFEQLKKVDEFFSFFFPHLEIEKKDFNRRDSEELIPYLVFLIDALIKSENFYKKRNLQLSEGKVFFPENVTGLLENLGAYFYQFNSMVFGFTRTESQTFAFVIENLVDYLNNIQFFIQKQDKTNLFTDYRFWIENFFKMFDQKIAGSIKKEKKSLSPQVPGDGNQEEIVFSNSVLTLSLSPFLICHYGRYLILTKVVAGGLIYHDFVNNDEFLIVDNEYGQKVGEFLLANFDFATFNKIKNRVVPLLTIPSSEIEILEKSFELHRLKQYRESHDLLKVFSLEILDFPLLYLLQIKNMLATNRIQDLKKICQKFSLQFPYYADGYEVLGDIYMLEENHEAALEFFDKALKLVQNKRIADKAKKVKDLIDKTRSKTDRVPNDYYIDISESVYQKQDEIVSRERLIRQMIEILLSQSRRNVMLIGDSGVGKSALIQLLALRILEGNVPAVLMDLHLKEINFVQLLTGSKYRGQFEEKILKYLNEFKQQKAILVLENIHLMISPGAARGTSLDLVNILKQFLRENSLHVIATTNYEEFKNNIEKDNTLMGFFQKIFVNEMTKEETQQILTIMANKVYSRENIYLSPEIIEAIIESAKRHVREKRLPDSAIMTFERCLAKMKLKVHDRMVSELNVSQEDVVEALADMLNLPETSISVSLKHRLLHLKTELATQIIGQEEAVNRLSETITTAKLELKVKDNRPDGVFLFIGPTGVGKTETALALSRILYGSEDYLIRIDMSEYMEKFTYSRFVGAAPGYVGYYDSNQLTDKVRQNPYSIILLDEIEKADNQLMNIFLQVFDAGRMTDARGNVVDFSHTTVIMTSNIGTSLFSKAQMGYEKNLEGPKVSRAALIKMLKKYFSLEFLNRIDEILIFKHLQDVDIRKIIHIQLNQIKKKLEKQGKQLVVRDDVIDFIIKQGYSREYGARHISRTIGSAILQKMASYALDDAWQEARYVICSLDRDRVEITLDASNSGTLPGSEMAAEANYK